MFKHKNVESVQPYKLGKGSFSKACRCDSTCMLNWLLLLLHVSCDMCHIRSTSSMSIQNHTSMQYAMYELCMENVYGNLVVMYVPQYGPHPVPLWCAQNGPVFAAQL